MTDNNLRNLPRWKKGATASERLGELSLRAREHPERFTAFVVVYREVMPNGNYTYRTMEYGVKLEETIGLCEIGKLRIWEDSKA